MAEILRDRKKRPVLVYFHGGAYNNGTVNSDLYDGKRLVHRVDVVVVTVNRRLNAFGDLYLGDLAPEYAQSGNGGAKCAVLMATPAAQHLFHRVMTMSGQQIKGASIEIAAGRAKKVLEKMHVAPAVIWRHRLMP